MSTDILKQSPFYLSDSQVGWIETTLASLSLEEKIGQLFFLLGMSPDPEQLKAVINDVKPGGMMYRTSSAEDLNGAYRTLQSHSKLPLLLAANLEAGGNGLINEGTFFGHNMLVAASDDEEQAYRLGEVCAVEGAAVGANMAFAPVIDINYNFRNPITNIRSFGDSAETVARMSRAYVKACLDNNFSMTIKHFPGDGTDGRDQHLVKVANHLSIEDWHKTYGEVYRQCIDVGANGLMVGHITLPDYFSDEDPLKDVPATLNPALLNNLLRDELGYNGLIMTDATLMTGFGEMGKRADLVPQSIAAGCDMFLFTRMPQDDYNHMLNGYKNGVITDERLNDAVTRILALKASLGLPGKTIDELVPDALGDVDQDKHREWAKELADKAVTLVRDKQNLLPLSPEKTNRIGIIYQGNKGLAQATQEDAEDLTVAKLFIQSMKKQGFYAFEYEMGDFFAVIKDMTHQTLETWKSQFDAIIFLAKWEAESNRTSLQLNYQAMGFDAPWWIHEVPTAFVSLGNPYHGYDVPMIPTFINAYSATNEVMDAVAEKLAGKSAFKGKSPVRLDFKEFTGSITDF